MKMDLNPTWGWGDILRIQIVYISFFTKRKFNPIYLSMVFCSPALDKRHSDGAHLGKLVDGFKAVVDWLGQQGCKLLVVEYFQAASGRNLADCGGMETMMVITVAGLNKYCRVRQALSIHLATHIVQMHSLPDVAPSVLNRGVSVHIGELAKAKPKEKCLKVCWWKW